MAYLALLLSLMAVDLTAAMSPGPNFVLVTHTAIHRTRRLALAVVLGLTSSNLVWCLSVTFGLSALFRVAPFLYWVIKILGGLYLVYLGLRLWRHAGSPVEVTGVTVQDSTQAAFGRGVLTNFTNPKAVVYFGSIFTLFMGPGMPLWARAAAIAIVLMDTVLWYGGVAVFFSTAAVQRRYHAVRRPIDRIGGTVMIAFGVRLALLRG
jgi:threonine efflux protein